MTVISLEIDDMKFELNVGYQCWLGPVHLLVATYSVSRKVFYFFCWKKLSGQTLTSWVDRSGLAQYFRITKRGKSKHLLVGFHLFVNSKLLTRSQRSEAMSSFRILDILSFLLNVSKFQVNAYVMEQKLCNLQKQQGQLSWATGQILFVCGLDLLNNDGHWQSF